MFIAQKNGFAPLIAALRAVTAPRVRAGLSDLAPGDSEMAPQRLEKMETGLENGAAAQEPVWDS